MVIRHISLILLVFLVIVAFVLRVSFLESIPAGLTNDEADIGYDAYSILLTGKDQWGQTFPLTSFKGFGDYRLPLYTYLVVPFISFFDLTTLSVRLPSAIFGTVSVLLIYLLCRKLSEKNPYSELVSLSSAFFACFSPWAIGLSRIGIESNVAITFLLAGMLFFLNFKKNSIYLFTSIVLFALTIYTYTAYTVFTPLVLVVFLLYFRKDVKKKWKTFVLGILLLGVLILPLFVSRSAAGVRTSQVSFINSQDSIGIVTVLNEKRGSCVEVLPSIVCKISQNKPSVFLSTLIENYLNHFSLNFLYLNGTTTQYSILPPMNLLHVVEFLIFFIGIIGVFYNKNKQGMLVLGLLLLAALPDSITGSGHYSRASIMMPFLFILEGFGAAYSWQIFKNRKFIRVGVVTVFICIFLYSIVSFLALYFSYYPKYFSQYSQFGYEPLVNKIASSENKYSKIYLSRFSNDTKQYIYYVFYKKYNPEKFQSKFDVSYKDNVGGWVSIDRVGKLHFIERLPSEEEISNIRGNVLFITHPSALPKDYKFFDSVQLKNGDVQFAFTDSNSLRKYYEASKLTKNE